MQNFTKNRTFTFSETRNHNKRHGRTNQQTRPITIPPDGDNQRYDALSYCNCAFCFFLKQGYIYFGNKHRPRIHIHNKTSFGGIATYPLRGLGGITDMAMYASDMQPSTTSKYATAYSIGLCIHCTLRCIKLWYLVIYVR